MSKSRFIGGFLAAFLVFATCGIAHAEQDEDSPFSWFGLAESTDEDIAVMAKNALAGTVEFSNGADVTETSYSTYSTLVISPFGNGRDGLRIKLYGDFARFTYTYSYDAGAKCEQINQLIRTRDLVLPNKLEIISTCTDIINNNISDEKVNTINNVLASTPETMSSRLERKHGELYVITRHEHTRYSVDLTPGYQITAGNAITTFYAGVGYERTYVEIPYTTQRTLGVHWGGKASVQTWVPLDEALWLSADASYFSGSDRYSTSARLGYKPVSWMTVGPEIGHFGDRDDTSSRAGAFLRVETMGVEAGLSAGTSFYEDQDRTAHGRYDKSPYGTASVYTKF